MSSNIMEDSVGTLLPVTQPNEVLRKEECEKPSIDEEYAAIDLDGIMNTLETRSNPEGASSDISVGDGGVSVDQLTSAPETFNDILKANGMNSIIEEMEKAEDYYEVWGESWEEDDVYTEAAKIDDDIVDIINTLNNKGYKTIYSCSGHPGARLKSDTFRDGVKDGKLYSTARIVFDKKYIFPEIPKGWELKSLDKGQCGIYVKGPSFNISKGMREEQFNRWKKKYMYHLEKWANDLPKAGEKKKSVDKFEEAAEDLDSVVEDAVIASLKGSPMDSLYMESGKGAEDDDAFELQNEVFGKMSYNYGWKKSYDVKLFGKKYKTHIKVESFDNSSPANKAQRKAYKKFTMREEHFMSSVEKALVSYGKKSVDKNTTEVTARKSISKVDCILFDSSGNVVILLQSNWEYEHGIGVQIIPNIKVGVQDIFL